MSLSGLTAGFVGQCWCDREQETDATWRIYAPGADRGIRIRVTAGRLFDTIVDPNDAFAGLSCFLGRVDYRPETEIRSGIESEGFTEGLLDTTNVAIAETLLLKRSEFEHEAEVRLLFQERDQSRRHEQIRFFPFDTNKLIDDVVLDPRWNEQEARTVGKQLRCFGYSGPISHSQLYCIPSFLNLDL